jgi:hypothetical protein
MYRDNKNPLISIAKLSQAPAPACNFADVQKSLKSKIYKVLLQNGPKG